MPEKIVNNYDANSLRALKGLEPVREHPGMYIGPTDEKGLHCLVREVIDNSIDEALAGYCDTINVVITADGSCSVQDNGRGIPTGINKEAGISGVELALTNLNAGGKFGGGNKAGGYKISSGLHGVGVSCVNALSDTLTAEVCQNGHIYRQVYHCGIPEEPLKIVGDTDKTGTTVTFHPDATILETTEFNYDTLKTLLRELSYLNKGLTLTLSDYRGEKERHDSFCYEGGVVHFIEDINRGKEVLFEKPVYFEENEGDDKFLEVAIQYNDGYSEQIFPFSNNIRQPDGGTHLDGFKAALTKVINDAGKRLNILKENEKLSGEDVREGITAVVSVKIADAQYESQTKAKLCSTYVRGFVQKAVTDKFGTYLEEHPAETKELILRCITAQRAREAARLAREETHRKGVFESTKLPGKLADCSDKRPELCEIYIVEGDSAGGTAKQGRDRRFQAILPLRGKILNVEKVRINRVLENEEIKAMITAFGCGIQENFDESKLRYDRIIIMTDADVDGSHIRILLLTFFFRYMRPLVENGHVYAAQPPLYKVSGKGIEDTYLYDDKALEEFKNSYDGKFELQRYKGLGEMNKEQLWETTMDPARRTLVRINVEDAVEADRLFSLLMGEQPELRRQFIEDNAKLVAELDI
ncbi:MAG: DNA topoisomerase (ATP-hydrolyzing) subunit B [Clostridiales bacterium]|nr:DNA topoisomerase (ATP-hydrolyzing) subunit B [Clostridiales bacterium]